ncbi:hypothetical protein SAMN04515617_10317 [Collimonas sp. OK242]|jgi:hypothetical protein|uniref:hypothetical protein n=1 Tax=Collimonas sp. OK242 TaxID=1798195 RepID=UPI00089511C3|nr:hypothetical protein [Collimonas sp. OK242]SDX33320.1 hypothetical protein SAMN04515617_10317 [Collimonas sp. OK242]
MKLLLTNYPAMQVTALRALTSWPLVCQYLGWRGAFGKVLKVRWPSQCLHCLRCLGGFAPRSLPISHAPLIAFMNRRQY